MEEELIRLLIFIIASIGTLFMVISALGILRLPDVFTRMHAAGKAATLGISCLLLSTGVYFDEEGQFWRMVILISLFFLTSPIASTSIARAAYLTSPPETMRFDHDELKDA